MSERAKVAIFAVALLGLWLFGHAGAEFLQSLFTSALHLVVFAVVAAVVVGFLGLLLYSSATGLIDLLTGRRREPIKKPAPQKGFDPFRKPD